MTIDEAIERCETLATNGHIIFSRDPDIAEECNEKYKQLAEWLEELKAYRENSNGYNKEDIELNRNAMYNKAIDDFVENISLKISESLIWGMIADCFKHQNMNDTSDKIVDYVINTANEIAEQLKAGGNIELSEYSKSKGNRTGK